MSWLRISFKNLKFIRIDRLSRQACMVLPRVRISRLQHTLDKNLMAQNRTKWEQSSSLDIRLKEVKLKAKNCRQSLLCSNILRKRLSWTEPQMVNSMAWLTQIWQQWLKADQWDKIMDSNHRIKLWFTICSQLVSAQVWCNNNNLQDLMALKITHYSQL